jgi:hypothetical protein
LVDLQKRKYYKKIWADFNKEKEFQNALNVPAIQLVHQKNVARKIKNEKNVVIVASAADWLAGLN